LLLNIRGWRRLKGDWDIGQGPMRSVAPLKMEEKTKEEAKKKKKRASYLFFQYSL
jgi:hypothetical protein